MSQKRKTDPRQFAYDMGVDYARNGATANNCHFSLFMKPEWTKAWERGRDDEQKKRKDSQ